MRPRLSPRPPRAPAPFAVAAAALLLTLLAFGWGASPVSANPAFAARIPNGDRVVRL